LTAYVFGPGACGALDESARREWLVADGRGGYAMGTVAGLRTRRYHGLLIVAGDTPAVRHLALASLDPTVVLPSGARVRLGAHEWSSGAVDPRGFELLERFDLTDGVPRWRWRLGDVVVERELAAAYGRPGVAVVHRQVSGPPVRLVLDALCTWRDAHGERRADGPPPRVDTVDGGAVVESAYRLAGPGWEPAGGWWRGAHHREEAARGLTADEDLWHAGRFTVTLAPGVVCGVRAWAGDLDAEPPPAAEVVAAARRRHRAVVAAASPGDPVDAALAAAADQFVVNTASGTDVVAGYPWFGAWSRDTMTAYEGLFLSTGRAGEGRGLLRAYAATLSEGMLANTADTGRVEYNTADATLWFLHAVDRHVAATGDTDLAAELLPALRGVVDHHLAGTRYGIRADDDGLLRQGARGEALTWMDARVYGVPVTPRAGKAVDVNALWVNGLAAVVDLARRVGADPGAAPAAYDRAVASFRARFPTPSGWLCDVVDAPAPAYPLGGPDRHDDDTMRPNQLLAWSLPHAPLAPDPVALAVVSAALLTPLGPRSLAPEAAGYRGRHRDGPAERDGAYHQGTVWPWLLGPLAAARVRIGLDNGELFHGIEEHLPEFGLGSVCETADGQPPHAATGCPFQAWSVGELLRVRRF
jgi:predicted glycogen debranching enzyme